MNKLFSLSASKFFECKNRILYQLIFYCALLTTFLVGNTTHLHSQPFEKIGLILHSANPQDPYKLSESSNCIVMGSGPDEYYQGGTIHYRNPAGGKYDVGYISKTDANGNVTQPVYTYSGGQAAPADLEIKSIAYIGAHQLMYYNSYGFLAQMFNYDLLVAVGKTKVWTSQDPNNYEAVIILIRADNGAIIAYRTFGDPNVSKSDCFNSVKFKELMYENTASPAGAPMLQTDIHSIVAAGYYSISAGNTDMFIAKFRINRDYLGSPQLITEGYKTYGDSQSDSANSVDLMGNYFPFEAGNYWKYVMCGGSRSFRTNNNVLNGSIVLVNNNLNLLADYLSDVYDTGEDTYNSVKFIGGIAKYWCQGFIVAGYHTKIINNAKITSRTLTRFGHNFAKVIFRDYYHKSALQVQDEESYGTDVVDVAYGVQDDANHTCTAIRSDYELYTPYNPSNPSTVDWLSIAMPKQFKFILVGWKRTIGGPKKVPILTSADEELEIPTVTTPPGKYSQIYNRGIYGNTDLPPYDGSTIFKSVTKIDETGAVRILGEASSIFTSECFDIRTDPTIFLHHESPNIFSVGTSGFNTPNLISDNSSPCSKELQTSVGYICTHKTAETGDCGTYPLHALQQIGIEHYPEGEKNTAIYCGTNACVFSEGEGEKNNDNIEYFIGNPDKSLISDGFNVYYNDIKNQIVIHYNKNDEINASLVLYDFIGGSIPINEIHLRGNSIISLPVIQNLSEGVYSLKIQVKGGSIVSKTLIIR